jgi:FkbH-like protein
MPPVPAQGILDGHRELGQVAAIQEINRELRHLTAEETGVYLLDYDALIALHGRKFWYDEQKWLSVRLPIAADQLVHLANEWLRFLHPLAGKVCKALVTDLDNTLWGGVIGEEGMDGIKVGPEHPGASYLALQRAILDLFRRGIILAVCSKNNPGEALEALRNHPGMLLRPEHFAALRINWKDKAQNLREIAAELNIGTDSLAFLDDNPVERARVRSELPEVTVIDLPDNPASYSRALRACPAFERLTLSAEDQERGRYYAEQRQRTELQNSSGSLENFYRSLQQQAEVAPVTQQTVGRVAQLTQKTNQFNLTTRRYSEQELVGLAADPAWSLYSVRVKDRFGDNGLVGAAITRHEGETCIIDTFLLSCRVIGRKVESAILAVLVEGARARGAARLEGWFLPTKKNAPARDFYRTHGFRLLQETESGSLWSLPLSEAPPCYAGWANTPALVGAVQLRWTE